MIRRRSTMLVLRSTMLDSCVDTWSLISAGEYDQAEIHNAGTEIHNAGQLRRHVISNICRRVWSGGDPQCWYWDPQLDSCVDTWSLISAVEYDQAEIHNAGQLRRLMIPYICRRVWSDQAEIHNAGQLRRLMIPHICRRVWSGGDPQCWTAA
jgi:hypothetical protein